MHFKLIISLVKDNKTEEVLDNHVGVSLPKKSTLGTLAAADQTVNKYPCVLHEKYYRPFFVFPLVSILGVLLKSEPPGAEIFLDGFSTGAQTPNTIEVEADKPHKVELRLDGHKPFSRDIKPAPELDGDPYVIHWRFQPLN